MRVIRDLRAERDRVDQVITALEELAKSGTHALWRLRKRRGRKGMDARERQEVSERMRKYWASRRKEISNLKIDG